MSYVQSAWRAVQTWERADRDPRESVWERAEREAKVSKWERSELEARVSEWERGEREAREERQHRGQTERGEYCIRPEWHPGLPHHRLRGLSPPPAPRRQKVAD